MSSNYVQEEGENEDQASLIGGEENGVEDLEIFKYLQNEEKNIINKKATTQVSDTIDK